MEVKVTTRRRDGVRGGDETLKRRVEAKFPEGGVGGAVRELASAEGLAPQDRDTLRALKEKHPSAPENLSLPDPPDGSVVPAVATEEDVIKAIMSFRAGASGGQMASALATFDRWWPMVRRRQGRAFYPL